MSKNARRWLMLWGYLAAAALSAWLALLASAPDADRGQVLELQIVQSLELTGP